VGKQLLVQTRTAVELEQRSLPRYIHHILFCYNLCALQIFTNVVGLMTGCGISHTLCILTSF